MYLLFHKNFFSHEGYAQGNDLAALIELMPQYYIQSSNNISKSY